MAASVRIERDLVEFDGGNGISIVIRNNGESFDIEIDGRYRESGCSAERVLVELRNQIDYIVADMFERNVSVKGI